MAVELDIEKFKVTAKLQDRLGKQLARLKASQINTTSVESAVAGAIGKMNGGAQALVIYGEPQSGKTEMMICLTAKLLDDGHKIIVHLMNDSVDLLTQNLRRFKKSGLAPAAKNSSELGATFSLHPNQELVVFCKKNARDLEKLIEKLQTAPSIVVIDDEADYATPNAKVNSGTKTTINGLIEQLIGAGGVYVGVTATPARLNLNNTFNNDTDSWVHFPPHEKYTGQDTFFPIVLKDLGYRLTLLDDTPDPSAPRNALVKFLVTAAYLNHDKAPESESNFSMLVHTSGKKLDHEADRIAIEKAVQSLSDVSSPEFDAIVKAVHAAAGVLYPDASADLLTEYVVTNASRATLVVLNSERDRTAAGDSATEPTSPFTVIIGGNIVSRGVTFSDLLSMFFTRNVAHKLQQDTYIQRARMFGARGSSLKHFELTIPSTLYADWHRCFVFHRLALSTLKSGLGSPVWLGDKRISVAASPSIDKATVVLDKGEMSFGLFDFNPECDAIVNADPSSIDSLRALSAAVGNEALPKFLVQYIETVTQGVPGVLALHTASSIAKYGPSADQAAISRKQGFMGKSQREENKFPAARHHIKIFTNADGKARVFYKFHKGSLHYVQNQAGMT